MKEIKGAAKKVLLSFDWEVVQSLEKDSSCEVLENCISNRGVKEGFIDCNFYVEDSNVFFCCYGLNFLPTPWSCIPTVEMLYNAIINTNLLPQI